MRRVIALAMVAALVVMPVPAAGVGSPTLQLGELFHVSADPSGGDHDGNVASDIVASSEGRSVAFDSDAPDLVADDTNGRSDIFVWSRETGLTERVSVSVTGGEANGGSGSPQISADGRHVLFLSSATDLVPGDDNGSQDAFIRDRLLGTTERVLTPEGQCLSAMSADARFVLCLARRPATFFDGRVYQAQHLVVLDRATGEHEFATVGNTGHLMSQGTQAASATISPNGRYVAFTSASLELHPGITERSTHVFVRDLVEDRTWLASVNTAGEPAIYAPFGRGLNFMPSVADNGRTVFEANATNIEPFTNDLSRRSYVHDPVTRQTKLAVPSLTGAPGSATQWPAISPDGRRVAVTSLSGSDLLPNAALAWRIVMRDLETGERVDVTTTHDGTLPIAISWEARFSPDGSAIAFRSRSSNLTPGLTGTSKHRGYMRLLAAPPPPAPNTTPDVDAGPDVRLPTGGGTLLRQGSFADPDEAQTWTATVDYGDGSGVLALPLAADKTFQLRHSFSGEGPFDVRVTVRDSAGDVGSDTFQVTVNRPPLVDAGPDAGAFPWTPFERTITFEDPDPAQTWTATVDYGDGTVGSLEPAPGLTSAFGLSHTYERTGTFSVRVTVTDDQGATGTDAFDVLVSPARSFIFVHGITGSSIEDSFGPILDPLRVIYRGDGQIRRFEYWYDTSLAYQGTSACDPAKEPRHAFDPSTDPHGMPLSLTARSLCDSQSDVGINAILLDRDVLAMHERFGGAVTLIANSMGGAITRAYLAFASEGQLPSIGHVDQVVFIQGAQQGSYVTLIRPALTAAFDPVDGVVVPVLAEAIRERFGYDAFSPAFEDLTPGSDMYRWVNPDPDHVPSDIHYVNVASDIHLVVGADIFGLARIRLADVPAGDYVMLPGSDDPREVPMLGGERFDPGTIGRGAPGSVQYVLRRDVLVPMEMFSAVIEHGPSVRVEDIVDRILVPEWHGAIGDEMGQITVTEGQHSRRLDGALLDLIRSLDP